jgi:hypothetical protein
MMFSYTHAGYLIVRMTPSLDGLDDDGGCHAASRSSAAEGETIMDNPTRRMDESGQGLKRAVTIAVALPLRVQPGIHMTEVSSSKRIVARVLQLYMLCPPPHTMADSRAIL